MTRYTVTQTDHPLTGPMAEPDPPCAMTRQFFDNDLDNATAFFCQLIDWLDVGCVQIWDNSHETGRYYI